MVPAGEDSGSESGTAPLRLGPRRPTPSSTPPPPRPVTALRVAAQPRGNVERTQGHLPEGHCHLPSAWSRALMKSVGPIKNGVPIMNSHRREPNSNI